MPDPKSEKNILGMKSAQQQLLIAARFLKILFRDNA